MLCLLTLHPYLFTTLPRATPALDQCSSPLSPFPHLELHVTDKNWAPFRFGSTAYSWLQNLSEPLAPPTKPLICPCSALSSILLSNYSKCSPFCSCPLDSSLSMDDLASSFTNKTEVMRCDLPHPFSCYQFIYLCINTDSFDSTSEDAVPFLSLTVSLPPGTLLLSPWTPSPPEPFSPSYPHLLSLPWRT